MVIYLPGIEISILVHGQSLEEYYCVNDDSIHQEEIVRNHEAKHTVTRYVESTTGKKFAVSLKVDPSFKMDCSSMSFCIFVDGEFFTSVLMIGKDRPKDRPWTVVVQGSSIWEGNASGGFEPMEFAEIVTNDESAGREVIAEQADKVSKAGEIKVYIRRKTRAKISKSTRSHKKVIADLNSDGKWKNSVVINKKALKGHARTHWTNRICAPVRQIEATPMTVNEKALKGIAKSHATNLGPAMATQKHENWIATDVDDHYFPRFIAVFKYRSDKALKSLGIRDRTPELEPEPEPEPAREPELLEEEKEIVSISEDREASIRVPTATLREQILAEYRAKMEAEARTKLDLEVNNKMSEFERFVNERLGGFQVAKQENNQEILPGSQDMVGVKRERETATDRNPRPLKQTVRTKVIIEILDSDDEQEVIELD